MAGAILGDVGGVTPVAPHIVMDVSCLTSINHQRFIPGRRNIW